MLLTRFELKDYKYCMKTKENLKYMVGSNISCIIWTMVFFKELIKNRVIHHIDHVVYRVTLKNILKLYQCNKQVGKLQQLNNVHY